MSAEASITAMDSIINHADLLKQIKSEAMLGLIPDEVVKQDESSVLYECKDHASWNLSMLNAMRLQRTLCDVVLCVGQSCNLFAHQAVLACNSSYLMNVFQRAKASKSGSLADNLLSISTEHNQLFCRVDDCFDEDTCTHLVEYMYCGKIWISESNASSIYSAATKLCILPVVKACSKYLLNRVTPANAIGLLKLTTNGELKQLAVKTVRTNFTEVMKSNEMEHLPHFQIEIRGQPVVFGDYNHFAYCVISYLVAYYANQDNSLSYCADSTHRIYVDGRDQNGNLKWPRDEEVEVSTISGPHFIDHDIAKGNFLTRESLPFRRYSDNSSEHHSSDEESSQFEIICTHANNSAHLTGLSYIDSKVIAFTILIKSIGQNLKEPGEGKVVIERSLSNRSTPLNSNLACLLEPRAGFALIEWNSSLLAIGGFNSGACLHTVEYLNKETNEWERWPSMKGRRGRCFAARINGSFGIFAGSNGAQHLTDCEILDPQTQTWSILNNFRLPFAHSVVVAGDNDIIYAICGSNEGDPSSLCYKYCLKTKVWQSIASTNYERVNPTAVWHEGSLFVFGGNSTWRCLRKCEVYKPDTDTWLELPSLPDPRRSAGVTSFNGKIYLIGGTDGTITMSAVDILNTDTMKWEKGPELLCRRSSAGVTTKDGYIFVVGGFDGHTFKRTTELYDGISWNLLENDHTNEIDIFTCHQE